MMSPLQPASTSNEWYSTSSHLGATTLFLVTWHILIIALLPQRRLRALLPTLLPYKHIKPPLRRLPLAPSILPDHPHFLPSVSLCISIIQSILKCFTVIPLHKKACKPTPEALINFSPASMVPWIVVVLDYRHIWFSILTRVDAQRGCRSTCKYNCSCIHCATNALQQPLDSVAWLDMGLDVGQSMDLRPIRCIGLLCTSPC